MGQKMPLFMDIWEEIIYQIAQLDKDEICQFANLHYICRESENIKAKSHLWIIKSLMIFNIHIL